MKENVYLKCPIRGELKIKKYDICLSYLLGSKDKFFMMLEDETDNIVVTNGFYRVRIKNEKKKLVCLRRS